jgi:ATP-dependent Clp protease ATP-binding subunit ClpC
VTYTKEAIETSVKLAHRYIPDRFLPDKAIDLMDEAGSTKRIQNTIQPEELSALDHEVARLTDEKLALVNSQNYEKAAAVRDSIRQLRNQIEEQKQGWKNSLKGERSVVSPEDIHHIISKITGIPLSRIAQTESEKLLKIEEQLHKTVIGQDDAINAVSSAIRRSRTGLSSHQRPMGSFIFLGPTGVGKSLLAKTLAEFLFGNEEALIRIDMSDFMEKHNVSRLVGAPPGYVGYEEGGLLTEKIRRRPYSVVLLDEIEKAHPDVFNLLLQVLEEGELQDNLGHKVSFRNTVLVMTSNAGAREISRDSALGFKSIEGIMDHNEIKSSALGELKRKFRPEFINRVDEIVVFHSLQKDQIGRIFDILMGDVSLRLLEMNMFITLTKTAREYLIDKGYDTKYGARPLRRVIQKEVEDPLSQEILKGKISSGDQITLELRGGKPHLKVKKLKVEAEKVRR